MPSRTGHDLTGKPLAYTTKNWKQALQCAIIKKKPRSCTILIIRGLISNIWGDLVNRKIIIDLEPRNGTLSSRLHQLCQL